MSRKIAGQLRYQYRFVPFSIYPGGFAAARLGLTERFINEKLKAIWRVVLGSEFHYAPGSPHQLAAKLRRVVESVSTGRVSDCYWGTLGSVGQRKGTINYSFHKSDVNSDVDKGSLLLHPVLGVSEKAHLCPRTQWSFQ